MSLSVLMLPWQHDLTWFNDSRPLVFIISVLLFLVMCVDKSISDQSRETRQESK